MEKKTSRLSPVWRAFSQGKIGKSMRKSRFFHGKSISVGFLLSHLRRFSAMRFGDPASIPRFQSELDLTRVIRRWLTGKYLRYLISKLWKFRTIGYTLSFWWGERDCFWTSYPLENDLLMWKTQHLLMMFRGFPHGFSTSMLDDLWVTAKQQATLGGLTTSCRLLRLPRMHPELPLGLAFWCVTKIPKLRAEIVPKTCQTLFQEVCQPSSLAHLGLSLFHRQVIIASPIRDQMNVGKWSALRSARSRMDPSAWRTSRPPLTCEKCGRSWLFFWTQTDVNCFSLEKGFRNLPNSNFMK